MPSKPLLIVESPSKAKTISAYLDGKANVLACVGHIKDLPKKDLGIDIEQGFKMTLKVLPDRRDFIKQLKASAKNSSKIILATDPDREGEAIAAHIASEIKGYAQERVQFTEITRSAILEGLKHGQALDQHLVDAQRTRRIIDRLVGYKLSPLLWNTLQKNMKFVTVALSAGRVQSAAVKILVDRERLRAAFKSAVYFNLKAHLETPEKNGFSANLIKLDGNRVAQGSDFDKNSGELTNQKVIVLSASQAKALVNELTPGPWKVNDIEEKPQISRPRPPFTTSTLQQEAARKLRFSARKTMRVAQKLYETGFITYMRTDSTHLSAEALSAAREEINRRFGQDYLPSKPVQYVTKVKNAQEAHEAIRPAGSRFKEVDQARNSLDNEAGRLYDLIWKRTIASQMTPAKLKQTTVLITNRKAVFRAHGKVVLFPGYMRVYIEGKDDISAQSADNESVLPNLKIEELLHCKELKDEETATRPPARYTEASLIKEMEAKGIGRPSTYANIIDTIQRRQYINNNKGSLIPTFLAVAVTQLLENHFESLVDAAFTARMEDSLDAIARGESEALPVIREFYYGQKNSPGLEEMLQTKVDIKKACTIEIKTGDADQIEARIGNYGPYLTRGAETKSIPPSLAPGDLTSEKAAAILSGSEKTEQTIGTDPETGQELKLKEGPYGLYIQLGDTKTRKSIPKEIKPENIDLDLALALLALPRTVGKHPETGETITADFGRFGPYLRMGNTNARLIPPHSPLTISVEDAIAVLSARRSGPVEIKTVGNHPVSEETLIIKKGRYGPYITDGKVNAALPRGTNPEEISLNEAVQIIDKKRAAGPSKRRRKKR